jgi:hypothetical protein
MTAAEIASTIIATLSLVVSLITAYLTLLSRFIPFNQSCFTIVA